MLYGDALGQSCTKLGNRDFVSKFAESIEYNLTFPTILGPRIQRRYKTSWAGTERGKLGRLWVSCIEPNSKRTLL